MSIRINPGTPWPALLAKGPDSGTGLRCRQMGPPNPESGLTLVELIICITIVAVLASAALPIARFQVKREKERELRRDLWEMRDAIDRYKDAADKGAMQVKADSLGYPPDLETLVNGVDIQDKKVKFLRKIPIDPMTGNTEWGLRSNQDDADSDSFGGQNVFDVHSKSQGPPSTAQNTPHGRMHRLQLVLPTQTKASPSLELMIVMVVISLLAAIAIPAYTSNIRNAREAVLKEDFARDAPGHRLLHRR